MRLIDADALIDAINQWMPKDQETWMENSIPPIENLVVSIMMTIEEQPTVDAEPTWIPVSERLPMDEKDVLVSVHFKGLEINYKTGRKDTIKESYYVDIANYLNGSWTSYSDEYKCAIDRHEIIAWAPLPKPYQGE